MSVAEVKRCRNCLRLRGHGPKCLRRFPQLRQPYQRRPKPKPLTTAADLFDAMRGGLEDGDDTSTAGPMREDEASGQVHCDGAVWLITVRRIA